ncbi:MAG: phosphomannomutase/phosphoglucomutase [Thermodesulfovibrionales bacterium]
MINERIFREYDIRGIAGKEIDRATAVSLGRAFGSFLKDSNPEARTVSVGRDVRLSSGELASGLMEGITSEGLDVYDLGVCPTPVQYFSLFHLGLDGGIMVTGSHNPPEYNGFKISIGKETIHGQDIQRLREIMLRQGSAGSSQKGTVKAYDILSAYKGRLLEEFSCLADGKYRRLKVAVDAGNGTAGSVVPEMLEKAGCDVIPLFCEPDGTFPNHHPDPTVVEYIQDLITQTKGSAASLGIGFDGDSDRIGVIDSDGSIVWGDQLMIILSRDLLKRMPGATVIGDVKCSQLMFDDIGRNGGNPIMWKTGHSLVKDKMKKENAPLAGEFSGHIFIGDRYYGYDDAIYTALRLVEIMKTTGLEIKELLSGIPRLSYTPELRIDCSDEKKKAVVDSVKTQLLKYRDNGALCPISDVNTVDGIRVVFEHGWGLIRSSNTQPVIVMRVEAANEESLSLYRDFLEKELDRAMGAI